MSDNNKRRRVAVPISEHPTTKKERIMQSILFIIELIFAVFIVFKILPYASAVRNIIVFVITFICMYFLYFTWTRPTTAKYKTVFADELTDEDRQAIADSKALRESLK